MNKHDYCKNYDDDVDAMYHFIPFLNEKDVEDVTCIRTNVLIAKISNGSYYEYNTIFKSYKFYENAKQMYYENKVSASDEQRRIDIFIDKLWTLLKERGIGQEEFAYGLGVTQGTVSNYLSGKTKPDIFIAFNMCRILSTENETPIDILNYLLTMEVESYYKTEYDKYIKEHP